MRFARSVAVLASVLAVACQQKKEEAAAPAAAPVAAVGDRILLGHVGSMTGSEATFGDSTDKGIRLAVAEANAKGGVKGKQIEVKTYDSQGSSHRR